MRRVFRQSTFKRKYTPYLCKHNGGRRIRRCLTRGPPEGRGGRGGEETKTGETRRNILSPRNLNSVYVKYNLCIFIDNLHFIGNRLPFLFQKRIRAERGRRYFFGAFANRTNGCNAWRMFFIFYLWVFSDEGATKIRVRCHDNAKSKRIQNSSPSFDAKFNSGFFSELGTIGFRPVWKDCKVGDIALWCDSISSEIREFWPSDIELFPISYTFWHGSRNSNFLNPSFTLRPLNVNNYCLITTI